MEKIFTKTKGLTESELLYCPGCTHGIIHRLVVESLEELEVLDKAIAIASVGCSVLSYEYFNCDSMQASHGRAPAVATGVKRVLPNKIVFTYQGDGDLASIGTNEIIHAANRGENITVIFVNNAIYGMTGGQMAPTTMEGQATMTTPGGKKNEQHGFALKVSEMLAQIPGSYYIERVSVDSPINVRKTKTAIKKAFANQIDGKGFSLIEVLSTCNINWRTSTVDALGYIREKMIPYYPLGVFKNKDESGE